MLVFLLPFSLGNLRREQIVRLSHLAVVGPSLLNLGAPEAVWAVMAAEDREGVRQSKAASPSALAHGAWSLRT